MLDASSLPSPSMFVIMPTTSPRSARPSSTGTTSSNAAKPYFMRPMARHTSSARPAVTSTPAPRSMRRSYSAKNFSLAAGLMSRTGATVFCFAMKASASA